MPRNLIDIKHCIGLIEINKNSHQNAANWMNHGQKGGANHSNLEDAMRNHEVKWDLHQDACTGKSLVEASCQ